MTEKLFQDPTIFHQYNYIRGLTHESTQKLVQETVARYLPSGRSLNILEVGSGIGELSQLLSNSALNGNTFFFLEQTVKFLQMHQKSSDLAAHFIQGDMAHLPIASKRIDAYVDLSSLDAVSDLDRTMIEATRVLAQDGIIIHFSDLGINNELAFMELMKQDYIPMYRINGETKRMEGFLVVSKKDFSKVIDAFPRKYQDLKELFTEYFNDPMATARKYMRPRHPFSNDIWEYLTAIANRTVEKCQEKHIPFKIIQGVDIMSEKLKQACQQAGLEIEWLATDSAEVLTDKKEVHTNDDSPVNVFVNRNGWLETDVDDTVPIGKVREQSYIQVMVAKQSN